MNLESKRASHRRWRARNLASVRAYGRKHYRENRERLLSYYHQPGIKEHRRKLYRENPEKYRAHSRKKLAKVRREVHEAYGSACQCCGEKTPEFLSMDYINGRKSVGHSNKMTGIKLYFWLRKNGFPKKDFRLLCYNCNCSRGFLGYCPHEKHANTQTH
jgi:hypothetical protein